MTDEARSWLVTWLRDAHAMEEQAEAMLSAQAKRINNYPDPEQRIRQHIRETQGQAARLKECLIPHALIFDSHGIPFDLKV